MQPQAPGRAHIAKSHNHTTRTGVWITRPCAPWMRHERWRRRRRQRAGANQRGEWHAHARADSNKNARHALDANTDSGSPQQGIQTGRTSATRERCAAVRADGECGQHSMSKKVAGQSAQRQSQLHLVSSSPRSRGSARNTCACTHRGRAVRGLESRAAPHCAKHARANAGAVTLV